MPIRRYQIARGAVDKTRLADDVQVKAEAQLTMVKGVGTSITGNAGVGYARLIGSDNWYHPDFFKNILQVIFTVRWDPQTTAGGLKLWNATDNVAVATSEPGVAGSRLDEIDITTTIKGYTAEKALRIVTKGDGTTAPTIEVALVRIVVSTTP